MRYDVLILGGGAAGMMCAIEAGKRGRRALVLEHAPAAGKKILISGGGRCNFTNLRVKAENFISQNPHFAKSPLARYSPADFIRLVEKHNIPYHEKTLGQLFCDRSARDITELLWNECKAAGAEVHLNCRVTEVRRTTEFSVETSRGAYAAPALVVATGGLSIPKMGATDLGYRLAEQFGLKIQPCYPALVPLTLGGADRAKYAGLAGVSAEVIASAGRHAFREKLLFTHRGLSGPAVLQASSYLRPGARLTVDLLPGVEFQALVEARRAQGERTTVKNMLAEMLPARLAGRWLEAQGFHVATPPLPRLEEKLHRWEVTPAGNEGYEKAEVTGGGVDTAELSSKTMEAARVPGLFFIGEVVDVTGWLGGYNFQWAWASGFAAGQAV